jgi:hypothetical protein
MDQQTNAFVLASPDYAEYKKALFSDLKRFRWQQLPGVHGGLQKSRQRFPAAPIIPPRGVIIEKRVSRGSVSVSLFIGDAFYKKRTSSPTTRKAIDGCHGPIKPVVLSACKHSYP